METIAPIEGVADAADLNEVSAPMKPALDAEAFHAAFETHGPAVYRYAAARVGPSHADEILAETFSTAWRARDRYVEDPNRNLQSWIIGIATVIIMRYRRAEQRWLQMGADTLRVQLEDERTTSDTSVEERIDAAVRARRLGPVLAHLPRREREAFLLHVLNDMSYEDVAQALDVPVGTVRSRISRGRARLIERMAERGLS